MPCSEYSHGHETKEERKKKVKVPRKMGKTKNRLERSGKYSEEAMSERELRGGRDVPNRARSESEISAGSSIDLSALRTKKHCRKWKGNRWSARGGWWSKFSFSSYVTKALETTRTKNVPLSPPCVSGLCNDVGTASHADADVRVALKNKPKLSSHHKMHHSISIDTIAISTLILITGDHS